MKINRKAQAAMEFLMTYGWAILAAIIAVAALAYFGVFSSGNLITGNAIIEPPFYIDSHSLKAQNISFDFRNGDSYNQEIKRVLITGCGQNDTSMAIPSGSSLEINVVCNPALNVGDTFRGDIKIVYSRGGSSLDLQAAGTIKGKVA